MRSRLGTSDFEGAALLGGPSAKWSCSGRCPAPISEFAPWHLPVAPRERLDRAGGAVGDRPGQPCQDRLDSGSRGGMGLPRANACASGRVRGDLAFLRGEEEPLAGRLATSVRRRQQLPPRSARPPHRTARRLSNPRLGVADRILCCQRTERASSRLERASPSMADPSRTAGRIPIPGVSDRTAGRIATAEGAR